ncbi:MAG: hypothetical protein AB7G21_12255 [Dehalococcoidia bacterium]
MLDRNILEERANTRTSVLIRAALLTPLAAVLLYLLVAIAIPHLPNSFLAVFVLTLGGIPAAIEAASALRDLRAAPTTTRGTVRRLWKKSRFLLVGRVDYMLVDGRLFEINPISASEVHEGDEVIVEHWPHTNVLISLRRAPAEPSTDAPTTSQSPQSPQWPQGGPRA